jgi:hypothetical protein
MEELSVEIEAKCRNSQNFPLEFRRVLYSSYNKVRCRCDMEPLLSIVVFSNKFIFK